MSGAKAALLFTLLATSCAFGFAASTAAQVAPVLSPGAQGAQAAEDPARGERIMNGSCQGCHDLRTIQVQAMSAEGWLKTVNTMIENGATVPKEDIPVLVSYLTRQHGPMPDGPGKQIVMNTCTMCHDLKRIQLGRRSSQEWEETLVSMLNEGAPLSDEDFPVVHAYLSKNFGVE
jgi:cytochrome c5